MRIITNSAFDASFQPLFESLGLRSIKELKENVLKLITFKSLDDFAPKLSWATSNSNSQKSCRAIKNADRDLELALKRTRNGQKGFSFRGAKLLNDLSANARSVPSLASFKSYL